MGHSRSDTWDSAELSDYADRVLTDRLAVVDGVADVRIGGERRYAIRVWLDRERLAARDITVAEVEQALRANNVELPAGSVESATRDFTVRTEGRLARVEEFHPLRLGEVATCKWGWNRSAAGPMKTAIGLGIIHVQANTGSFDRVRAGAIRKPCRVVCPLPKAMTSRSLSALPGDVHLHRRVAGDSGDFPPPCAPP